jgi:hypothetical protein
MRQSRFTGIPGKLRELVTQPGFFIIAGVLYIAASALAALDPAMRSINPRVSVTLLSIIVFLLGLAGFHFGLRTSRHMLKLRYIPIAAALVLGTIAASFILEVNPIFALLLNLFSILVTYFLLFKKMRFEYLFILGLALFWVNFIFVGFPLLNPELHVQMFQVVNPVFVLGYIFMVYALIRLHPRYRLLWLLAIASAVMSSYRTALGVIVFTWLLLELRGMKRVRIGKAAITISGLAIICIIFILAGYQAKMANSGEWTLDPIQTLEYRLALTMGVFDDIVGTSFPIGRTFGQSLTMEATEYNCRVLYGCEERITATAFGEAMLDFGLLGVFLIACFVAAVLGNLHRHDYPLYAFLFATLLAALDTGINIFTILLYIYLGWIGLVKEWK